jgi:drug/metabolite transporter (DMT)-like permease
MTRSPRAVGTLVGGLALLLWGTLAWLSTWAVRVPPFELVALCFGLAAVFSFVVQGLRGRSPLALLRQPAGAWLLSVGGLFGYHALYFVALRSAPAVEANLVNYLWPLLIVLFSAFLPGERLHARHVLGALLGFAGTAVLVVGGGVAAFDPAALPGYLAAAACAVVWAGYSVANRRYRAVPSGAVAGFCLGTALLSGAVHLASEPTVLPTPGEWLVLLAMAVGPLGAAFFAWDHGVKHGDVRALGTLAYGTPLLSSLLLAVLGPAPAHPRVWLAAALIVGGAAVGAGGVAWRRSTRRVR